MTEQGSEIPMRDTTPAPPPVDEATKPDNRLPGLPSTTEILDAVGRFSEEMRDSIQEIRSAVEDSNRSFLDKLDAMEKRFNQRMQNLANEVSRVHQELVEVRDLLEDHDLRIKENDRRIRKLEFAKLEGG